VGKLDERGQVADMAPQRLLALEQPLQVLALLEEFLRRLRVAPQVGQVEFLVELV